MMTESCKNTLEPPAIETFSREISDNKVEQPILLVEDYEPNILVATMVLKSFGYPYEIARNGQEALDLFSPHKYSLMLMDVEMPIMDGYETTRRIRSWEKAAKASPIPILGMTAHALKGHREKCLEVGMNDYLAKPFTPNQLHSLLGKYWKKISA
jgi:CheY-like chemotaxis protein